MEKSSSVLIIQDCIQDATQCKKALESKFNVIGTYTDGKEGYEKIRETKPDFVIISLVLKGYDGFEIMNKTKDTLPNTKYIVLSNFNDGKIVKKAIKSGAAYYMIKPIDYDLLNERIENLDQNYENQLQEQYEERYNLDKGIDERISRIFISIGIPPHIKGYAYLRDGIKLAVADPDIINSITKKLYPAIGRHYHTTPSKVERAIRHAIEVAWNKGRIEEINSLFGVRAYSLSEKPTNSEFIALIADRILLDEASKRHI